jgi:hypothetical protein
VYRHRGNRTHGKAAAGGDRVSIAAHWCGRKCSLGTGQESCSGRLHPGSAESNEPTAAPSCPARMCDHVQPRLSPWPSVLGILGHAAQASAGRLAAGENRPRPPSWRDRGQGFGPQVLAPLRPERAIPEPHLVRLDRARPRAEELRSGPRGIANSPSTPPVSTISSSRNSGWTPGSNATCMS